MIMAVMHIRIMGMTVPLRLVSMPVRVRLVYRAVVAMVVVCVMAMAVLVRVRLVGVFVDMLLREMKPQPKRHENASRDELRGYGFANEGDGHSSADE